MSLTPTITTPTSAARGAHGSATAALPPTRPDTATSCHRPCRRRGMQTFGERSRQRLAWVRAPTPAALESPATSTRSLGAPRPVLPSRGPPAPAVPSSSAHAPGLQPAAAAQRIAGRRDESSDRIHFDFGQRISWEQRNSAIVRPLSGCTTVESHTCVVLPRCAARTSARSRPSVAVPRKFDFNSIVVKFDSPLGQMRDRCIAGTGVGECND